MTYTFSGTWSPTGFIADDLPGWAAAKKALLGQRVTVTLEKRDATRSDAANRRYWGRIVRGVQAYLSMTRDVPLSKDQTHYFLKAGFLGTVEVNGILIPKDSHNLPSDKFSAYCEEIEGYYAALGVDFPSDY